MARRQAGEPATGFQFNAEAVVIPITISISVGNNDDPILVQGWVPAGALVKTLKKMAAFFSRLVGAAGADAPAEDGGEVGDGGGETADGADGGEPAGEGDQGDAGEPADGHGEG